MATTNNAHWALRGEAIVALVNLPKRLAALPVGLGRLPGPALVIAERFDESPIGAFVSLVVAEPARLGPRPGFYCGVGAVNHADARKLSRQYWGLPYELGALTWESDAETRCFVWQERSLTITATPGSVRLPVLAPTRGLQHRRDGFVVVPGRTKGVFRRSSILIEAEAGDVLAELAGSHSGFVIDGLSMRRHPARHPLGVFSTLRAPLRAPEPGILGMDSFETFDGSGYRMHLPQSRASSSAS